MRTVGALTSAFVAGYTVGAIAMIAWSVYMFANDTD